MTRMRLRARARRDPRRSARLWSRERGGRRSHTGNWYWIVTEIEQVGLRPLLVHPRKAKLMMGLINKTDKLDVHGLNRLQRNGALLTV